MGPGGPPRRAKTRDEPPPAICTTPARTPSALERLVESKLASGMTNPDRMKDLADIQELIRHATLPLELGDRLDAMVRTRYEEI